VHKPVWVTDNALILSLTRDAFELRYLAAVLRTRNLNEIADRTAQPLITGTKVRAQTLPVPPLAEQTAIVEHLAQITDAIGRPITGARRKIDLLREYRTRLIADVVTGKLDVREAAARLPDEAEEPEPLDEIEAEGDADEAGADDTDEEPAEAEA
jgi:type I restriction enzyme S subunit